MTILAYSRISSFANKLKSSLKNGFIPESSKTMHSRMATKQAFANVLKSSFRNVYVLENVLEKSILKSLVACPSRMSDLAYSRRPMLQGIRE